MGYGKRTLADEDWQDDAACARAVAAAPDLEAKRAAGWDRFFPADRLGAGSRGPHEEQNLTGVNLCATCCVRAQCLDYALRHKIRWGIWGGLTTRQRLRLRRQATEAS